MIKKISYKLLLISIIIGACSGIVISLFRITIPKIMFLISNLINFGQENIINSIIFVLIFIFLGFFVSISVNKEPMIGGSGIPQIAGKLHNKLDYSALSCLINKIIGGLVSIGSGLTLGREGPSVQIGGCLGEVLAKKFKLDREDTKTMIIASSACGITSAFTAPISAMAFALEELMKKISRYNFIYITSTIISSSIVTSLVIGNDPVIKVKNSLNLSLKFWIFLIFLGILVGFSSILFNKGILYGKKLYKKLPVTQTIRSVIPFFITSLFLLFDKRLLGSGENFISLAGGENVGISVIIYFYFMKLFLLLIAFCSGIPGGIFFPLLAMGSLLGNFFGSVLFDLNLVGESEIIIFSMLAMAAHFSSIVRAPLTGMLLIVEMTGGRIDFFLPIIIVSFISYLVAENFHNEPIYESLLDIMVKNKS
ncbi:MAG: ClC family H(+)/Cl(-) exchange transporter [Anaerococcus hydrogenalis]|uniref:ClC family H(+)/Cl(-) exchange transporter n=1 Tax=Anaerococcus hydrogenalis TaxID=33029 RepID=UPI002913BDAA|nr:ClC family H(+)/Cl(-) exchange transporter [Anaerococcus hydrogenalis]MDU3688485.1 ClC family H(+)/Cl(-) exchange transporter [Anaerococcus hydrogenalis]